MILIHCRTNSCRNSSSRPINLILTINLMPDLIFFVYSPSALERLPREAFNTRGCCRTLHWRRSTAIYFACFPLRLNGWSRLYRYLNDQYLIYDDKDILRHYLRISSTNLYDLKKAFFLFVHGVWKRIFLRPLIYSFCVYLFICLFVYLFIWKI